VDIYKHTNELRNGLTKRGISWERKGNTTTRWMYKGRVWIADVQEPSGEVILTTLPHTVADVLKEVSA
jgi:hypothetical protein